MPQHIGYRKEETVRMQIGLYAFRPRLAGWVSTPSADGQPLSGVAAQQKRCRL